VRAATYPAAAKMINLVDDLGAVGDGKTDNTDVFRRMVAMEGYSFFLPDGVYLIRETVSYGQRIFKILEGQSRDGTIIRLMDNAPGFDNPTKPKAMFVTGQPPAIRFRTSMRSLTFDTGNGNPGAVGLNFYVNNQGSVRNVRIRSGEGGKQPGRIGLAMNLDMVGPLLVRDLLVEGFDIGIDIKMAVNSVTLEDITLRGQREVGIQNWQNLAFIRKLRSENDVIAVRNSGPAAVLMLADSILIGTGKASEKPGIVITHEGSANFILRTDVEGYRVAIKDEPSGEEVPVGRVDEWSADPPAMLHAGTGRMLHLPVKELPEIPWEHDFSKWADVTAFGANPYDDEDDAPAVQKAIDSGATVVYFPQAFGEPKKKKPMYIIDSSITLRGNVNRLFGNEQFFKVGPTILAMNAEGEPFSIPEDKPLFRLDPKGPKQVIIERFGKHLGQNYNNPFLVLDVNRDVVISSSSGVGNVIQKGPGVLYADDIVAPAWKIRKGAELYAWQFNLEGDHDYKFDNDGGLVWCLGLKTEHMGPTILTRNGGKTEVLGAHLYTCVPMGVEHGQIFVEDASFAMAAGAEYAWTRSWATRELLIDTRNGERRSLQTGAFHPRAGGSMLPFVSLVLAEPAPGSPPPIPQLKSKDVTAESVTLQFESPGDSPVIGFEISRKGEMPSFKQPPHKRVAVPYVMQEGNVRGLIKPGHAFTESKLTPQTVYQYSIVAYDAANRRSAPLEITIKTGADTEPPAKLADFWPYQIFDTEAQLRIKATTDNVGVNHYLIRRMEGDKLSREIRIEAKDIGAVYTVVDDQVTKGAKYVYQAIAVDAAGNTSQPATLPVEIPTQPPSERILELESFDHAIAPPKKAPGHIFGVLAWSGMQFDNVPMGSERPFDRATIRYGTNDVQGGTMMDLYLGGELVETAKRWTDVKDGTFIGSFHLASTGGYDKFREVTIPLQNVAPGKHTLTVRIRRGTNKKAFNAVANIDRITFARFESPPDHAAAVSAHTATLAEHDVPEGAAQRP
ncbi:MAG: glycosyl hydrolase family 28-related protein, partial [Opitutales bacterium]